MRNNFNWKIVTFTIGMFLCIESLFIALAAIVATIYNEYDKVSLIYSTAITLVCGIICLLTCKNHSKEMGIKEGYLIVSFVWIIYSLFGMLPFYLSRAIPNVTDAFFETMSGFTTTGASILTNVEALPHGLLFWRSLTQWLGGMGFVVLSMAILPFIGGDIQLFSAEATGPIKDKIQPRIKETARRIWVLYFLLTLIQAVFLCIGGMSFFDAICHAFTTLSTGGYSTKQDSVAHWQSPFIQYTIILFMIIGGTNFTLLYMALIKGNFKKLIRNEEFKTYLRIIISSTAIVAAVIYTSSIAEGFRDIEKIIRDSLFQTTSIMTSTGFSSTNYAVWSPVTWIILIILMLLGASSGSTSGGIKIARIILLVKNGYYEFKRRVHPNAILPIRMNGHVVTETVINSVFAFLTIYITILLASVFILSLTGLPLTEASTAAIASIGNVGPGLGSIGPIENFSHISAFAKWFLSFLMLVGRLELFTILLLLSPAFWRK